MTDLSHRIANAIGLGRLKLLDDTGPVQMVQVDQGAIGPDNARRLLDRVRRVMEFGFVSSPPVGTEAVLARLGGSRTLSLVIGTNHQASRPRDLQEGDSALYDVRGARVWLTANGIVIDGAGMPVTVQNTPKVRVVADLVEVTGDVVSRADGTRVSLNALRDAYDAHKHPGVTPGVSTTGTTDHAV